MKNLPEGTPLYITIPLQSQNKGDIILQLIDFKVKGFYRILLKNEIKTDDELPQEKLLNAEPIHILIDRLKLEGNYDVRLNDSLDQAFREGKGCITAIVPGFPTKHFSQFLECAYCGLNFIESQPWLFSL